MKKKIVIIGAAGFVGLELVNQLEKIGEFDLYAVTRDNGSFLLEGKKITLLHEDQTEQNRPFDFIVNLAYPTSGLPQLYPHVNAKIFNTIKKLCTIQTKIIQISTIAVFGFGLDKDVKAEMIPKRRDFPYIEAKLDMEHLIINHFSTNDVAIVRLGNVWGAASGTWTGAFTEKLLFGQYVGTEGLDGYSNVTDVINVASYIIYLINNIKPGKAVYHLAEFSHIKWSQIIALMSAKLNVEPVYSDAGTKYSLSLKSDVKGLLKTASLGETYRKLFNERFVGSLIRSGVRLIGSKQFQKIKKTDSKPLPVTTHLTKDENTFLTIVDSQKQFKLEVLDGWKPALTFEQSWQTISNWMSSVGY